MSPLSDSCSRTLAGDGRHVPAYGPVDAVLTYAMFYAVLDRATPTLRTVLPDVVPGVSPGDVGFALAALMWFVLVVSVVDQARRQFAAVGIGHHSTVDRDRSRPAVPSESTVAFYLVSALVAAIVAAWAFEPGVETAIAMIEVVFRPDAVFDLRAFAVMVAFFVAYGVATWAVDRLVVGGIRALLH